MIASTFNFADGIAITFAVVLLLAVCGCGHFLNQMRDILRDMQATQRKMAQRMGVHVK